MLSVNSYLPVDAVRVALPLVVDLVTEPVVLTEVASPESSGGKPSDEHAVVNPSLL